MTNKSIETIYIYSKNNNNYEIRKKNTGNYGNPFTKNQSL